VLALASALPATAQGGRDPVREVDPYTEGDPEAMEEAGYLNFGPFIWGDEITTQMIEDALGGVPLIWVETEHFRIGSSLDEYKLGSDRDEKKKLDAELKVLRKRIPNLKKKVKVLDPWLRLHLFAMRLEDHYADFKAAFGLTDDDFPSTAETVPFLGKGPYLGMQDKFTVLLMQKKSSMARFTSTFCKQTVDSAYRYYFSGSDTLCYGMSFESLSGSYRTEAALHFGVIYGLTQNLSNAYRGFSFESPLWWQLGLARWFGRRVDDAFLLYTAPAGAAVRQSEDDIDWEPKVWGRVEHDYYPSMEEILDWTSFEEMQFADHVILWSRIDFLMSLGEDVTRELFTLLQEPLPWGGETPREELLRAQAQRALEVSTGLTLEAFDEAWCDYVKKEYSKR
jgi:hypothetical protein